MAKEPPGLYLAGDGASRDCSGDTARFLSGDVTSIWSLLAAPSSLHASEPLDGFFLGVMHAWSGKSESDWDCER
jgi:hypothetical protein